jgi:hypothetical protein
MQAGRWFGSRLQAIARRGRRGDEVVSVVMRGRPIDGGWSGGGRGEQLGRLGQLGLSCRIKRNVGLKMERKIGTWITNFEL